MAYSGPAKLPMAAERAGRRQRSSSLSTIHSQVSVQEYIGYVFFGFKRAFFFMARRPSYGSRRHYVFGLFIRKCVRTYTYVHLC